MTQWPDRAAWIRKAIANLRYDWDRARSRTMICNADDMEALLCAYDELIDEIAELKRGPKKIATDG
jgi:hypothetical protein